MRIRHVLVLVVALTALSPACAYYNMLYNANKHYTSIEKLDRDRDGNITRQQTNGYDEVIAKCQTMIGTYPDSRHVDDAMLLIARCLYGQDRFGEAAAQCDSIEAIFPDTELMAKVWFLKGQALADWGYFVDAIIVLDAYVERYPREDQRAEAHYYLTLCHMSLGQEADAVANIRVLEDRFGKDPHTFAAQIEAAEILLDSQSYERSKNVYETLNDKRVPKDYRYDVWMGLAYAYVGLAEYGNALSSLNEVATLRPNTDQQPPMLLLRGETYVGMDSVDAAIGTYSAVAKRFSVGKYGAEAHYRLGLIYEQIDSLDVAKTEFEAVSRSYARSEYANDAIKRAGSIGQLIRLRDTDDSSPMALALRKFSLAELQLTQFDDAEKALETYQQLLTEYPESEFAPKAAYAVGYIYSAVLRDSVKARVAYEDLLRRYPTSPQAANADMFLVMLDRTPDVEAQKLEGPQIPEEATPTPSDSTASNGQNDGDSNDGSNNDDSNNDSNEEE